MDADCMQVDDMDRPVRYRLRISVSFARLLLLCLRIY